MPRTSHHSSFLLPRISTKMYNLRNLLCSRPFRFLWRRKQYFSSSWMLRSSEQLIFTDISAQPISSILKSQGVQKNVNLPIVLLRSPSKVKIFPAPVLRISTISVLPEGLWFFPWGRLTP
jgi:hypothetical protein